MAKLKDLTGQTFGRLTILGLSHVNKGGNTCWDCICVCGIKRTVPRNNLVSKNTKSCGCLSKEHPGNISAILRAPTKHGMSQTRFYGIYSGMKERCNNPKSKSYQHYGARGIKCLWGSFEEFRDDMYKGYLESIKINGRNNTQLDRINNNGNYYKENCRWATRSVQNRNKSTNNTIEFNGQNKCISDWAEELGIKRSTLYARLTTLNWPIKKCFEHPINKYNKKHPTKDA